MDNKLSVLRNKKVMLYAGLFISAILIHWIIMGLAFILLKNVNGIDSGLFSYFYEKYNNCGDTEHYINIAKNGYYESGEFAKQIVFYPLYPLLMKIAAFVTGNYFVAGVLISNVCLGVSACFLYKLTNIELGEDNALDSVAIYLLYPFGVFLVTVFTESLFIMLVLMCLTFLKERKWLVAGIVGMLAALSRSQGIALFVPAVYEAIVYMVEKKKFNVRCLPVCLVPCGTLIYLLINKIVQGDWFAFIAHEEAAPWYNTSHWISDNLTQHYNMALEQGTLSYIIYWVQLFIYFLTIAALFYGLYRGISVSVIAFGGAYMFLSYLHGWLISGPRYMMGCVTLYVVYASIKNRYIKGVILVTCAVLTIFYTLGSWQGQAIM